MTVPSVGAKYAPDMDKPVMRIGAVADLLGVCVRMVRIYEQRGLVQPARRNNQRLYSFNDVCWLARIRELVNDEGYDLDDIARLVSLPACWQLLKCPEERRAECPVGKAPGKRCWEIARRQGRLADCGSCQLRRISAAGGPS
jgi:MerR family transcriptional regulator/heat shock protein HspR